MYQINCQSCHNNGIKIGHIKKRIGPLPHCVTVQEQRSQHLLLVAGYG